MVWWEMVCFETAVQGASYSERWEVASGQTAPSGLGGLSCDACDLKILIQWPGMGRVME